MDNVQKVLIKLQYIPTKEMLADLMTNSLSAVTHDYLISKLVNAVYCNYGSFFEWECWKPLKHSVLFLYLLSVETLCLHWPPFSL